MSVTIKFSGKILSVGSIQTGKTVTDEVYELAEVEILVSQNPDERIIAQAVNKNLQEIAKKNIGDTIDCECRVSSKFRNGYPQHSIRFVSIV